MNKVTLTSVRKVKGGKFQIEIQEFIENPTAKANVAGLLNASDKRFTQAEPKARRAWVSAEAADLKANLGIDVATLKFAKDAKGNEVCAMNIASPKINGQPLRVLITDSFEPSYDGQSPKLSVGTDGNTRYFMNGGKHIYSSTSITLGEGEVAHKIIKSDELLVQATVAAKKATV